MRSILLIAIIFFLLAHCSEKANNSSLTQKQIDKYSVEVKNHQDEQSILNKPTEEVTREDNKIDTTSKNLNVPKVRSFDINQDDIVFGDINSRIILVEYFSPTCTHCAYYKQKVFPEIKKNYIDTKKIAYVIREFIANRQDRDAAILARCTNNKEDFLKFVNVIIGQQDHWAYSSKYRDMLTNIGKLGGVSAESYANCLNNEQILDTLMSNSKFVMMSPRFIGTPAFFINGVQFTKPFSIDVLSAAIEDAIKNAQSLLENNIEVQKK